MTLTNELKGSCLKGCRMGQQGNYSLYSVHCTLYPVPCTLYRVHCKCTLYPVPCTVYRVHCKCTVYSVHCPFTVMEGHHLCSFLSNGPWSLYQMDSGLQSTVFTTALHYTIMFVLPCSTLYWNTLDFPSLHCTAT